METQNKTSSLKEARFKLKELSAGAKILVQAGAVDTVNEFVIKTHYQKDGHELFKTFNEWVADGYRIKKGSKAFVVWGRPKRSQKIQPESEQDEYNYFPICYLFSNLQVERRASNESN